MLLSLKICNPHWETRFYHCSGRVIPSSVWRVPRPHSPPQCSTSKLSRPKDRTSSMTEVTHSRKMLWPFCELTRDKGHQWWGCAIITLCHLDGQVPHHVPIETVVKNFPREFLQMLAAPSLCFNVSEWLGCLDSSVTLSFQISPLCQGAGGWSLCKSWVWRCFQVLKRNLTKGCPKSGV